MTWVLEHSPTKGSDRLVLISIANYADKSPVDGAWEAWPGIATIQQESGLDRTRTVNDALSRLINGGHLERVINGAPDMRIRADHRPNLYRILLPNGVTCSDTRCKWCGVTDGAARGDALRPHGVTDGDVTGCRETSPEPLVDPNDEPKQQPLPGTDPLTAVFDAWTASTKRTARTVLDSKRRRLIEGALKTHPLPDVLDAVRGWEHSPWHRGENPERRPYNDLGLLLRDAANIEKFRDLARGPRIEKANGRPNPAHDPRIDTDRSGPNTFGPLVRKRA
jgi:hypothetical protein